MMRRDRVRVTGRFWKSVAWVLLLTGCRVDKEFIFHPSREIEATPESVGLAYEDVYFKTADGVRLNGWFIPAPGSPDVMIWFHGNAGNISHRVDNLRRVYDELGVSAFIFDYREYGRSEGSVSEAGTYRDAEAALDYLKSRTGLNADRMIYFGRSLGAAIAVELALKAPPRALILESPMTSIREMARKVMPYLPVGFLINTEYDSLSKIGRIHVPILILHGDRDEVVPFEQGKKMFAAANPPKEFYVIPGASHNDTYLVGGKPYWETWRKFLRDLK
ncbi:MAG: alpha/beta hydrolase [Nitrospirae bacterium]|nr:alpha/beta hydrolase [Nitrospirota bacterium]